MSLVDSCRIAYTDRGGGEPVVFLHGTPSYSYAWRNIIGPVEAAGYRTIAYDLLGYGASERPLDRDTSVTAQVGLLAAFLDQLGLSDVTLVAHDIGGAIAQRFALAWPERVRRLMLIDTVSYDSWPSSTWRAIIDDHLETYASMSPESFEDMLTRQLTMTVANPAAMSGETLAGYLAPHRSPIGRQSFFEHQVRHYDSRHTAEITGRLRKLRTPTKILWGAEDRWQNVAYAGRLVSDLPNARLTIVPNAGHFLTEDAPNRVVIELLTFLACGRG